MELPALGLSCHTGLLEAPDGLWEGPGPGASLLSPLFKPGEAWPEDAVSCTCWAGLGVGGTGLWSEVSSPQPSLRVRTVQKHFSENQLFCAPVLNLGSKGLLNQVVGTRG